MDSKSELIISCVKDFYISSRDFNGIPIDKLYKSSGLKEDIFKTHIIKLINDKLIELIYEGDIPNPHIRAFPAPSTEEQIKKIRSINIEEYNKQEPIKSLGVGEINFSVSISIGCCVYPTPEYLKKIINWQHYNSHPFTLRLAMGEWWLRPYYFELGILAIYRNDPRYRYHTDDTTGSFSAYNEELLNPSDMVFVQHFGFGFDEKGTRVVVILLGDLVKLTPEHQQIWKAKMLKGSHRFRLHPDFRKSILGHFYDKQSVFSAFLTELKIINQMAHSNKGIPILKSTFEYNEKPENFGFLLLPTQREFEYFCQTLDRMMSDNLNGDFFEGDIFVSDLKTEEKLAEIKGIRKLEIWLNKKIIFPDPTPKDEMLKIFRNIRRLRSKPAHTFTENRWDENLLNEQRELIKSAYKAVRTLRLILANAPGSRTAEVPDWLVNGEIRTF